MGEENETRVPGWEQIVNEQSDRVFRLAYRLTGNIHDAEDLTQDVFVKVFRALANLSPATWRGGSTGSRRTSS